VFGLTKSLKNASLGKNPVFERKIVENARKIPTLELVIYFFYEKKCWS